MTVSQPQFDAESAWQPFTASPDRPWSNRLAAHLLRRAGFGGSISEIEAAQKAGLQPTIDRLINASSADSYNEEMATAGRLVSGGQDSKSLAAWWLLRMVQTPCPLIEKITLFWHGHFATGAEKVKDARAMLQQNILLRKHALGPFEPLVQQISRDVAMLVYLDSEDNRKTRPNENYARELMELFCLGTGNYTEHDIKEIARCFTGWQVQRKKFNFNPYQHDNQPKSFLGETGNFDGNDAVQIILQQDASTRFIARKLIRFFVFDGDDISDELVQPLANELRESGFNIGRTVRTILSSQIFFSEAAIGRKIKSPVELAVGFLRFFDASVNMQELSNRLAGLGQLPLYPPNVKGWDGGRAWINASTILARANLISELVNSGNTKLRAGSWSQWAKSHPPTDAKDNLQWMDEYFLAAAIPPTAWTELENFKPSEIQQAISWLAALPEFQLN